MISYSDIKVEFDQSLGFIRGDIRWLCDHNSGLNYTVALLVGCACEGMADGGAYPSKERAFAELLPDDDWKKLAKPLFDAVRNGLVHSFDTKHIPVGSELYQIVFNWGKADAVWIGKFNGQMGALNIGTIRLGQGVCKMIDEFEARLKSEPAACQRFRNGLLRDREVVCSKELWDVLKQKS